MWKVVPGYSRYRVNEEGDIHELDSNGEWKSCKVYEKPTSVGTYLVCHTLDDNGKYKPRGVHQLVCLTFRGSPPADGRRYEVNHIDANKHNNKLDNLEVS